MSKFGSLREFLDEEGVTIESTLAWEYTYKMEIDDEVGERVHARLTRAFEAGVVTDEDVQECPTGMLGAQMGLVALEDIRDELDSDDPSDDYVWGIIKGLHSALCVLRRTQLGVAITRKQEEEEYTQQVQQVHRQRKLDEQRKLLADYRAQGGRDPHILGCFQALISGAVESWPDEPLWAGDGWRWYLTPGGRWYCVRGGGVHDDPKNLLRMIRGAVSTPDGADRRQMTPAQKAQDTRAIRAFKRRVTADLEAL